jgi:succinyl-CoA synthetase beta subunit
MNIHEDQAKELLAKFGVAVPRGGIAYTAAEAVEVARRLGGQVWVVKAQIHAGGRGKAGGVKVVRSEEEVAAAAPRCSAITSSLIRPGLAGARSSGSMSRKAATSRASFISAC